MSIKVLELNKPNNNGHIYTQEVIEQEILKNKKVREQLKNKSLFIEALLNNTDITYYVDMKNIIGIVTKIFIKDNFLCVNTKILDTPLGRSLKKIKKVYINGLGAIDNYGKVNNYTFLKFSGR